MTKLNRSIDRGLAVLEAVYNSGTLSLAALATYTGLPKPTLLRICATLESRRWLLRRSGDGNYQIGSAFPHGGGQPNLTDRLVAVGKDVIVPLSRETGLGSDLAVGIGDGRVEIVDTTRIFKLHGVHPDAVGFRPSPILSALGAAFLFAMPGADRAQALHDLAGRLPREDAQALPRFASILQDIAKRGYAVRSEGHWGRAMDYGALPGAIAVPIIVDKKPVGAVNLVWNASEGRVDDVVRIHLAQLQLAALTIGRNFAEQG